MANSLSQLMTERLAKPQQFSAVGDAQGRRRTISARFVTDAGHGVGHIYRLERVLAHDRIKNILSVRDADAGMSDCDLGLRVPNENAAVDPVALPVAADDILVDGINISSAGKTPLAMLGAGANSAAADMYGKPLWELSGQTEPPVGTEYELVLIARGNPAGGADHVVEIDLIQAQD